MCACALCRGLGLSLRCYSPLYHMVNLFLFLIGRTRGNHNACHLRASLMKGVVEAGGLTNSNPSINSHCLCYDYCRRCDDVFFSRPPFSAVVGVSSPRVEKRIRQICKMIIQSLCHGEMRTRVKR